MVMVSKARFGFAALVAMGAISAASYARAAVPTCPAAEGKCSTGTTSLHFEAKDRLMTTIDTGWWPSSSPLQVRANVAIDPVKGGGPVYSVDMPRGAIVEASWPDTENLTLKVASGSQTDGTFKVQHTLTPNLGVKVNVFGASFEYNLDATRFLNYIPGAKFNYNSLGVAQFAPWGFAPVSATVSGPDLANSRLFAMDFEDLPLPDIINDNLQGTFSVNATTRPTFTYKTTKVTLGGQTITTESGEAKVRIVDGDFMEVPATVEGELTFKGSLDFSIAVTVSNIRGSNVNLTLPFKVFSYDYDSGKTAVKVAYPASIVHIPLPNVKVPTTSVDLGFQKGSAAIEKTVQIANTGEMGATLSFESSDPQFIVPSGQQQTGPASRYDLKIGFKGNGGPATAKITVKSNDPDSPTQEFTVTANGAKADGKGEDSKDAPTAENQSSEGCGCRTVNAGASDYAGYALLGLGVAAVVRRRRRDSK
jgi:MYXO-CTERM domain-containing protein